MATTKNLCAQIPIDLHERVSEERERLGQTTSEYIVNLIQDYYNMIENQKGGIQMTEKGRTMAFQIPEELFQRIKRHLERETLRNGKKLTQRDFVLNLITQALDEADAENATEQNTPTTIMYDMAHVLGLVGDHFQKPFEEGAEIVTGSLQDLDRAVLVGQRTFGKGLVQTTRPLGYNSFLKVTTAKYYIPSGRCIQAIDYSSRDEKGAVKSVPDSLVREFRTRGGRKVYDGGGIMPDERIDPEYISRFAMTLYAMGYVDDFADLYFREHGMQRIDPRTFTLTDADYERFEQFMADKEVKYESDTRRALNRIKEAARADLYEESLAAEIEAIEAGIRDDKATNLQTYKREIMETLNGAVILRYSYAEGVTEHTLTEDREVHRAVALLDDGKEYARILHEQDTVRK